MITARSNPVVRQARALKERRGRVAFGQYPIEGVRLVEEALTHGASFGLVLYNEPLLRSTERGSLLLERLRTLSCPGGPASLDVLGDVCDTIHPAGVMAALPLPPDLHRPELPGRSGLSLVLGEIQDPGNAGSLLRTAAAVALDGVVAITGTVDLFAPKVVRAAMGAHLRLDLRCGLSWSDLDPWLALHAQIVIADSHASHTMYDIDWRAPTVLVLGNEAHGLMLPHTEMAAVPVREIAIPMPGGSESLNVAAAGAVLIYEALRQRTSTSCAV